MLLLCGYANNSDACSVGATCPDGSTISCSGTYNCEATSYNGYVSCDGGIRWARCTTNA